MAVAVDAEIPDTISHVVPGRYMDAVRIVIHSNQCQGIAVNRVPWIAKQLRSPSPKRHQRLRNHKENTCVIQTWTERGEGSENKTENA